MHLPRLAYSPKVRLLVPAILLLAILEISCGGSAGGPPMHAAQPVTPTPAAATNDVQHVFIVVLENKNYRDVIGSSSMPYANSLVTANAVAANFYANGIDSLPNYFMLTVGNTVTTGATYTTTVTLDNVVRQLIAAQKTWKAYAESLPSVGYLGSDKPPYVKVHNPFAYLAEVVNDSKQAANIVPFKQFASDLAAGTLPQYGFIIPNNNSNSHDCPPNMTTCNLADTLQYSDTWLKNNIGPRWQTRSFSSTGC